MPEPTVLYEPTLESLRKHEIPEWYDNAKLGIFIHWGLHSVPALAAGKAIFEASISEWDPAR